MKKITTLSIILLLNVFTHSVFAQTELWGTTLYGGTNNLGTVFKTTQDGTGQTIINFDTPSQGNTPFGDLIQATNGKFYGFTAEGGVCGFGNFFEFDISNNNYNVLVEFDGATTGGFPNGTPLQASNGLLYGINQSGGPGGNGTMFSYDIVSQTFTVLNDFSSIGAPTNSASFIQAANGKLYAMLVEGPSTSGAIIEYDIATNALQIVYSFPASGSDGYEPWGNLVEATNGKLYGVTAYGGLDDYGVVFEFDIPTSTAVTVADFDNTTGRYPYGSLMQASNGLLYGMTNETSSGVLYQFDPVAQTLTAALGFNGVIGSAPWFGTVCEGSNGKLYGLTSSGGTNSMGTLFEYDPVTQTGLAKYNFTGNDGYYPMGSLMKASNNKMYGMSTAGGLMQSGNIFEYDYSNDIFLNLIDMNDAPAGAHPSGGLTEGTNGMLYGISQRGGPAGMGSVYVIDPVAGTCGIAAALNSSNGGYIDIYAYPGVEVSELCLASNGKMYGIVRNGGANLSGALFEFDPAQSLITLKASFTSATTGKYPGAGLMQASNGKLYGVTMYGGGNNKGTLFSYDIALNSLVTVFNFDSTNGGLPKCILTELSPGSIYGVSQSGGAFNNGTIFKHNIALGTTTRIYDLNFASGTGIGSGTLFTASNGTTYIMFTVGGANSHGTICSYDLITNQLTKLADFPGTASPSNQPGALTEINGKLYASHSNGGTTNVGGIYEFNTTTNSLVEKQGFSCANGNRAQTITLTAVNTESVSKVWPGDCNYDLITNNVDFLNIGLAYGNTDVTRPGANNTWTGQPCPAWSSSFNTTVNHKHADTNGDGSVNILDSIAISSNYGQTHPFRLSTPLQAFQINDISLVPLSPAIAPGQVINFEIRIADTSVPLDSLYGIAFTLSFDPALITPTQTSLNWSPSVLGTQGTDMEVFSKYFPVTGTIEIALTRINHTNAINVSGVLGILQLKASATVSTVTPLVVTPSLVYGITAGENEHQFISVPGSTNIDPALIGLAENSNENVLTIYPNPAKENVIIAIKETLEKSNYSLELYNSAGKCIYKSSVQEQLFRLDVSMWNAGIYSGRLISNDEKQIQNFRFAVIK